MLAAVLVLWLGLRAAGLGAEAAEPYAQACEAVVDPGRARLPPGVFLRGCLALRRDGPATELPASELSGLAWDHARGLLYSVSDRGWLLALRPIFQAGRLVDIQPHAGHVLRRPGRGKQKQPVDAEAVVFVPAASGAADDHLIIAFENPPRVARYSLDGQGLETLPLPPVLAKPRDYSNPNEAFEALASSPLGLLVSPQRPLKSAPQDRLRIYSLTSGQAWDYPPLHPEHSSIADLARLPDGRFLALERVFGGVFLPVRIALRRFVLSEDHALLEPETLVEFSSAEGFRVDNFEGLAVLDERHVMLVSDDNQSAWQRTLMWYVEMPLSVGP